MKSVNYINGWWRLWIVSSLVWLVPIFGIAYKYWPSEYSAKHQAAFYYQLSSKQRSLLETEKYSNVVEVRMPNGHILSFSQDVPISEQTAVARAYDKITVSAQNVIRQEHIQFYSALALIPCMLAGLLGIGIAWVRKGFKSSNN